MTDGDSVIIACSESNDIVLVLQVPLNVIYQLMGPRLVRKFVIEEILKATLNDYVQKVVSVL